MGELGLALFRPPLGAAATAAALAVVLGLWTWHYARRGEAGPTRAARLWLLRVSALVAIGLVLAGPSVWEMLGKADARRVRLTLLVDTSASMQQRDVNAGKRRLSRWDAVRRDWLTPAALSRLRAAADVRLMTFDGQVRTIGEQAIEHLHADGERTRLFAALAQAGAGPPGQTIVVLSDGHDTRRTRDAAVVRELVRRHQHVFVVPVGTAASGRTLALTAWADAQVLIAGERTRVRAMVVQHGLPEARVRVTLIENGRVLARHVLRFAGRMSRSTSFGVRPRADKAARQTVHDYTVRVRLENAVGRAQATASRPRDDDQQQVFVTVSHQPIRVALFEGEPYWDTRALARALRADAGLKLTEVFALGDRQLVIGGGRSTGRAAERRMFSAAGLDRFDVVILGKGAAAFFPGARAKLLKDYVLHGGALVLARGEPFDGTTAAARQARRIIAPIMPVRWGRQRVRELKLALTPSGAKSPLLKFSQARSAQAVLSALPGMLAATRVRGMKAATVVLLDQAPGKGGADEPPMAALAQMRAGSGRVLAVLSEGLWRWALLPGGLKVEDSVLDTFWSRAVRWLADGGALVPGQALTLRLDRSTVQPGHTAVVRVLARYSMGAGFKPRLVVDGPSGKRTVIRATAMGPVGRQYQVAWRPAAVGIYRIALVKGTLPHAFKQQVAAVHLVVRQRRLEQMDPSARPGVLTAVATATGGARLPLAGVDRLIGRLKAIAVARQGEAAPRYDYARWWLFAWIAASLGLEWWLRRRWGLL